MILIKPTLIYFEDIITFNIINNNKIDREDIIFNLSKSKKILLIYPEFIRNNYKWIYSTTPLHEKQNRRLLNDNSRI